MATNHNTLPIRIDKSYKPILTAAHVKADARQYGAKRIDQVDAFVNEIFRLAPKVGLNPDVLAGQWNLETDRGRSEHWATRLNPGGIGVTDQFDHMIGFDNGVEAARAMTVHLMAYARGHDNRLAPYIILDPRFVEVHKARWAASAKVLNDLAGKWATDTLYGPKVAGRIDDMADAIKTPPVTPAPSGDAPLPSNIVQVATGNSHARFYGRRPVAIVFHITDAAEYHGTASWFKNPESDASAHVVIDRDGTIYQFVSSTRAAWTNGDYAAGGVIVARRDIPLLWRCVQKVQSEGGNFNDFTLNIEHVATRGQGITNAQKSSSIALSKYWRDRYDIVPSRGTFWRHADVNSVNRPYCPGSEFPLADIIRANGGDPMNMGR